MGEVNFKRSSRGHYYSRTIDMSKRTFTTGEIGILCDVAPRTVNKWFDSGKLKGYRIPDSRDRRVPREELIKFLQQWDFLHVTKDFIGSKVSIISTDHKIRESFTSFTKYEVGFAADLFRAGLLLADNEVRVHLTIVDMEWSKNDCLSVITRAREIGKVILLGAEGDDIAKEEFWKMNSDVIMQRPFGINDLITTVNNLIGE